MCSTIADIFGYTSMSCSRPPDATIGKDRTSLAIRPPLAEDLTQEDTTVDIQTNLKRITICHILHGELKNRHAISAGSYADSEHAREYGDYLTPVIFLMQDS